MGIAYNCSSSFWNQMLMYVQKKEPHGSSSSNCNFSRYLERGGDGFWWGHTMIQTRPRFRGHCSKFKGHRDRIFQVPNKQAKKRLLRPVVLWSINKAGEVQAINTTTTATTTTTTTEAILDTCLWMMSQWPISSQLLPCGLTNGS